MRPHSRILLSAAAFAAFLAPAFPRALAETTTFSAGVAPRPMLPPVFLGDSGFGAGLWIPPTDSPGFASAQLFDAAGHVRYTMRANLLAAQPGLPGMDEQGGFLGQLFSVDAGGRKILMGKISGKWIRHPDGWGEFDVEVLAWSGDRKQPLVSIGSIQGSLLPHGILPGPERTESEAPGELVLVWSIHPE